VDAVSDRESEQIAEAISELFRAGRSWSKAQAARFDPELSPLAYGILRHLALHEGLRAADLVAAFGMDKSAVSRQIAALREQGLVDSVPDPADRRASLLVASPTAMAGFDALRAEWRAEYERALEGWAEADRADFARLLRRFTDAIR
jgi:DNA-binding MarR family transcriptional regulator